MGKAAPPIPTIPASLTRLIASSLLHENGSSGDINSSRFVPSLSITIHGRSMLPGTIKFWIFLTLPATDECTGVDINLSESAIF